MASHNQHGADVLPFARAISPDQLQRIYGDTDLPPVDDIAFYTANELRFSFFLGGAAGAFLTVALAFCWSWFL